MRGENLSGISARGTVFRDVRLDQADLSRADLAECAFFEVTLEGANLRRADLSKTLFRNTPILGVQLAGARLHAVSLDSVELVGIDLRRSEWIGASLERAKLDGSDLSGADLSRASFMGASLIGAKLLKSRCVGTDFRAAQLARALLEGSALEGVNAQGADFSEAILALCREAGVSTAVESSSTAPWATMDRLRPLVDLWMCDVKHIDPGRHRELTGGDNRAILANIRRLCEAGAKALLRLPLVPGLNDDDVGLRALGGFVRQVNPTEGLEVLPYHRLGEGKYDRIRKAYPLGNLNSAEDDDIRRAAQLLREGGAERVFCERIPDL